MREVGLLGQRFRDAKAIFRFTRFVDSRPAGCEDGERGVPGGKRRNQANGRVRLQGAGLPRKKGRENSRPHA